MPELLIGAAVDVVVRQERLLRRPGPRDRVAHRPAHRPRRHQRRRVDRRVGHRLGGPPPVAEPGPDHRARAPDGRLRARAGPRAGLVRGPVDRRADVDPERRRQPARAVPRHRRHRDHRRGHERGLRRHRVLRRRADPGSGRVPPHPRHHLGLGAVPAPARAPLRRGAGRGRRRGRRSWPTTWPASPPSGPSPPRTGRSSGSAGRARPTARPTDGPSSCRRPSSRSSAWRSWPPSPPPCWSAAGPPSRATSTSACSRCWCT